MIPFSFHRISFSKFTCKTQSAYFVCSFACMASLVSSFNHSKLRKFISLWKINQNTIKLYRRIFFYKANKKCKKTRGEMFCTFAGMTSLMLNSKLYIFITYWNLIKVRQNFVKDPFSIKLTKICHKNRGEVLVSSSL